MVSAAPAAGFEMCPLPPEIISGVVMGMARALAFFEATSIARASAGQGRNFKPVTNSQRPLDQAALEQNRAGGPTRAWHATFGLQADGQHGHFSHITLGGV